MVCGDWMALLPRLLKPRGHPGENSQTTQAIAQRTTLATCGGKRRTRGPQTTETLLAHWREPCFFFAKEMKGHTRHKIRSRSLGSPIAHLPSSDLEQVREIWRRSICALQTEGETRELANKTPRACATIVVPVPELLPALPRTEVPLCSVDRPSPIPTTTRRHLLPWSSSRELFSSGSGRHNADDSVNLVACVPTPGEGAPRHHTERPMHHGEGSRMPGLITRSSVAATSKFISLNLALHVTVAPASSTPSLGPLLSSVAFQTQARSPVQDCPEAVRNLCNTTVLKCSGISLNSKWVGAPTKMSVTASEPNLQGTQVTAPWSPKIGVRKQKTHGTATRQVRRWKRMEVRAPPLRAAQSDLSMNPAQSNWAAASFSSPMQPTGNLFVGHCSDGQPNAAVTISPTLPFSSSPMSSPRCLCQGITQHRLQNKSVAWSSENGDTRRWGDPWVGAPETTPLAHFSATCGRLFLKAPSMSSRFGGPLANRPVPALLVRPGVLGCHASSFLLARGRLLLLCSSGNGIPG